MNLMDIYLLVLPTVLVLAVIGWLISLPENNVNAVDSFWSMFFLASALVVIAATSELTGKNLLIFCLVAVWALRLSVFLTFRNWGKDEDRRYQAIRANNNPGFRYKSFYIIYLFQALLASVIFMGLAPGLVEPVEFRWFDLIAISLAVTGIVYESIADWQMLQFKSRNNRSNAVMSDGLWGLSRHPNYFGEFLFWWGMFLAIVSIQHLWVVISPLIMTVLLLKVSGVSLMEKDIKTRRPEYAKYIENTPAFFPRFSSVFSSHKLKHKEAGQAL